MTRIAVVGSGGMLGHDLISVLGEHQPNTEVVGFARAELDITDSKAVSDALEGYETVINAAAYTRVDDAETNRDLAFAVNAKGAENIATACATHAQRLIHVSTDYVFDGTASTPYSTDAALNPRSVYGESKAQGERSVREILPDSSIIVRTAWLYGENGPNFVKTMLALSQARDTLEVVDDQVGQPTWSRDLAQMIHTLVDSPLRSGIFHGTNAGQASWWGFARTIFETAGLDPNRILPTTSADFVRPAPRPAWSVLDHAAWAHHGLPSPRHWEAAFGEAWETVFARHFVELQEGPQA